jgi:hypothetical protein
MARLFLVALTTVLAGVSSVSEAPAGGRPARQEAPGKPAAPLAPKSATVKLECGVEVEPLTVQWVEGQWQALPDLLRKGGNKKRRIIITRAESGEYVGAYDPPVPGEENRFVIFKADCYRIAQIESKSTQGPSSVMYAVLNGHSERLSLDFLPELFPQAWKSKELIEAVGAAGAEEVPVEKRLAAFAILAASIDEKGTFMRQDLTLVRPVEQEPDPIRPPMPEPGRLPEPGRIPPTEPGRIPPTEPGRVPPTEPGRTPPTGPGR